MGSAASGFLTGFFGKTAENIDERKTEAKEYFDRQMEIAQTKGMQAREKRATEMTGAVAQAKQLQQIGMPKDMVIAVAKQNPADLAVFAEQMQDLKAKGVPVDEEFFRSVISVQGETGSDESIEDVMKRIYMPLKQAAEVDPEGVAADPKTSIWSAMMGYNAMDRARGRLNTEEVADGMTAQDLIRLGDSDINTDPNVVVTLNADVAGNAARAAKEAQSGTDGPSTLSPSEIKAVSDRFQSTYEAKEADYLASRQKEVGVSYPGLAYDTAYTPEVKSNLRRQAYDEIAADYQSNGITIPPSVMESFLVPRTEPTEGATEASPEEAGATAPDGSTPSEAPPSVTPAKAGTVYRGMVLVQDKGDGTSLWRTADGKTITADNARAPDRLGLSKPGN